MPDVVPEHSRGEGVVPFKEMITKDRDDIETPEEARSVPDADVELAKWCRAEIAAGLRYERHWRSEAAAAEAAYIGSTPETDMLADKSAITPEEATNYIHANIETLKPMIYSNAPEPVVRRRFMGDGEVDPTDMVSAEVAQRIAMFLIDTTSYDNVMEQARDHWLIPGRAMARVFYDCKFAERPEIDPLTNQPILDENGQPLTYQAKVSERVYFRTPHWKRCVFAPANDWDDLTWVAFEIPMTRAKVEKKWNAEIAERLKYPLDGLSELRDMSQDEDLFEPEVDKESTGAKSPNTRGQSLVYEIWDRENRRVIWWSPHDEGDKIIADLEDPLQLENFFNICRPLLATTINGRLVPRPEIRFYEKRAKEIDIATEKLNTILKKIAVAGVYPGKMEKTVRALLDGESKLVNVTNWQMHADSGGLKGIIDWLPIDMFIAAAQALVQLREQAKLQMYEVSGISDIMRGETDPNETAAAQNLKGRYSNLRLADRQKRMALFAKDMLQMGVELVLEHFEKRTIIEMVNLDLPETIAERETIKVQHAQATEMAKMQQIPPPPPLTHPDTSWEEVFERLGNDLSRKFAVNIETDSTIMPTEDEDKKARVDFLTAFTTFMQQAMESGRGGVIPMKLAKELLLFAVRGFPKSRTIEGMIQSLPEQMEGPPPEDVQVTVAKIRAEVDKYRADLDFEAKTQGEQAENRRAGSKLVHDAMMRASDQEHDQQMQKQQQQKASQ